MTLEGYLRCRTPQQAARVRAHLPDHIRLTRAEAGCVSFNVVPTHDPLVWRVDEEFTDSVAFEAHQTRTKASPWAGATKDVPRAFRFRPRA